MKERRSPLYRGSALELVYQWSGTYIKGKTMLSRMRIYSRECPSLPLVTIFKSRENLDSRKKRTPSNAARLNTAISKASIRNHDATVQAWKLSGAHVRKVSPKNMGAKPRVRRRVRCEFREILTVHNVHGIARDDKPSQ